MLDKIKSNKEILILITIMLISSVWLITRGMPYAHDIEFHYDRVVSLTKNIKSGDFFALIHNFYYGYGYATGLFYSNFYFYIPSVFSMLGLSYMASFKSLYLLINILTTLSIYFSLKSITNDKKISIFGTILYMFSGYRLVDIYVRGAMGEILAFMIIPIVILGIYEILYRNYHKWYLFTIGFVLLLLSHLITTFLVAVFIFIFILCSYKKLFEDKNRLKYLIISGVVGLMLGGFFLFPIIEQKLSGNINIFVGKSFFLPQDEMVSLKEFFLPADFFNKYLGFSLVLLLPIRYFIKKKNVDNKELLYVADTLFILSIIAWVSTTSIFPWKLVGDSLDFIQFPWRLLIVATTFLTVSYSIYLKFITKEKVLKYTYLVIIIFSSMGIILYSLQYGIRKVKYNSFVNNVIGTGEYLLYETDTEKLVKKKPTFTTNNKDILIDYKKNGTSVIINYKNNFSSDTYIEIPLFNYLGYSASGATIIRGDNNLIRLDNLSESGIIEVSYKGTNIQKVSYIISTITLVGIVIYIIREKRR